MVWRRGVSDETIVGMFDLYGGFDVTSTNEQRGCELCDVESDVQTSRVSWWCLCVDQVVCCTSRLG